MKRNMIVHLDSCPVIIEQIFQLIEAKLENASRQFIGYRVGNLGSKGEDVSIGSVVHQSPTSTP